MTAIEYHHQIISIEYSLGKFAIRLTSKSADAQDLVQETILKVLLNKEKYTSGTNFKAWAFTIMKNIFINNYRRKIRHNTNIEYNNEFYIANEVRTSGNDEPDSTYSAKEINQNIEQLRDSLKIPFKMHINGFKYKEIADELNLSMGTLKSRIFLSRKKLKFQLEN